MVNAQAEDDLDDWPPDRTDERDGYEYEVVSAPRGFPLIMSGGSHSFDIFEAIVVMAFFLLMIALECVVPIKVGILRRRVQGMPRPRVIYKEIHPRGTDVEPRMDELFEQVKNGDFDHVRPSWTKK